MRGPHRQRSATRCTRPWARRSSRFRIGVVGHGHLRQLHRPATARLTGEAAQRRRPCRRWWRCWRASSSSPRCFALRAWSPGIRGPGLVFVTLPERVQPDAARTAVGRAVLRLHERSPRCPPSSRVFENIISCSRWTSGGSSRMRSADDQRRADHRPVRAVHPRVQPAGPALPGSRASATSRPSRTSSSPTTCFRSAACSMCMFCTSR